MGTIGRSDRGSSIADLARVSYDVAIVGGGIHGAMLHLEAARAGLRSVLVERNDFGGATSEASLRIVHGGLRYLRSLNVARSVESTRERQWYSMSLPRLVTSLPCLLPIYERAGNRAAVLELGLAANDFIGAAVRYLDCTPADVPRGYLVDARRARELAPAIPDPGLAGGAVWHDLQLRCPGRVIVEALRWAADLGGSAANYVEALELLHSDGRVRGIAVVDAAGTSAELTARVVVNAAGPWAGELAARWGAPDAALGPLVVAWNLLLDLPALSGHAVALKDPSAPERGMLFATPLGGRLLIGTGYAPLGGRPCEAAEAVAEAGLDEFLAALNRCMPGLAAARRDVLRLYSGVLPAAAPGASVPRSSNVILSHGPLGLFTVSGTKFTTARSAARRALGVIRRSGAVQWPATPLHAYPPSHVSVGDGLFGAEWTMRDLEARLPSLERMLREEAIEHLEDLVLRRTTLGDQPGRALTAARSLCAFHEPWRLQWEQEVARLAARLGWRHAARAMNRSGPEPAVAKTA
jgi:glycerol-3-phosphate dehydrogenase